MKIENALKGNNSLIFQQRVVCSLIYFTQSLQKIDLQVKSMTFTYIHQLYMLYIVHAHVPGTFKSNTCSWYFCVYRELIDAPSWVVPVIEWLWFRPTTLPGLSSVQIPHHPVLNNYIRNKLQISWYVKVKLYIFFKLNCLNKK